MVPPLGRGRRAPAYDFRIERETSRPGSAFANASKCRLMASIWAEKVVRRWKARVISLHLMTHCPRPIAAGPPARSGNSRTAHILVACFPSTPDGWRISILECIRQRLLRGGRVQVRPGYGFIYRLVANALRPQLGRKDFHSRLVPN